MFLCVWVWEEGCVWGCVGGGDFGDFAGVCAYFC